jgi:hypothetical protein
MYLVPSRPSPGSEENAVTHRDRPARGPIPAAPSRARAIGPALLLALLLAPAPGRAELVFTAVLDGSQAVPPTDSPATGTATLVLDEAREAIAYSVEYSVLEGEETEAHFHQGRPGTPGPILFTLPLGSPKAGTWPVTPDIVAELLAGRVYVLIHSDPYWTGEIRGNFALESLASDRATWGRLKAIFEQP